MWSDCLKAKATIIERNEMWWILQIGIMAHAQVSPQRHHGVALDTSCAKRSSHLSNHCVKYWIANFRKSYKIVRHRLASEGREGFQMLLDNLTNTLIPVECDTEKPMKIIAEVSFYQQMFKHCYKLDSWAPSVRHLNPSPHCCTTAGAAERADIPALSFTIGIWSSDVSPTGALSLTA